ncbi:conserved hypothetical protein [Candidatus Desulfarcum epimagneticum]|uniref:Glycosyltransferase subfamily 4-like N-terminal domain-containing protein n=1 Tax=uncultured Desulfobacteraceae bacterium TaxID=218296 RepID=A0A484HF41_9BACT|nr:conserved hypothetical protein [uncultured Desulfobacteraceae bacterium]
MKLLLIAYEYPPILGPQSLRWFYLANELVAAHDDLRLHVLTADIKDIWGFSGVIHQKIKVRRVFPGPFIGLSGWLATRMRKKQKTFPTFLTGKTGLLTKIYLCLRQILNQVIFPDVRTEWLPFAWIAMKRLMKQHDFDVVISAYEPGVNLMLGWLNKKKHRNKTWILDMADPLITPYTPKWRLPLDKMMEKKICRMADHILVTTPELIFLFNKRHGIPTHKFTVIRQGF